MMGAGVIVAQEEGITDDEAKKLSVSACLSRWPSSTRAELAAIFLVLLVSPENSEVVIHCDSQAAIDGIQDILLLDRRGSLTARTWLKQTNRRLKNYILTIIHEKKIYLSLVKVKAHIGIRFNELADEVAKEGANDPKLFFDLNLANIDTFSTFSPYFDNNLIDVNYRRFFMSILKSFGNEQWRSSKAACLLFCSSPDDIDWKITWQLFYEVRGFRCM